MSDVPQTTIEALREAMAETVRLREALAEIRSIVGTSTQAWLIANRALENKS